MPSPRLRPRLQSIPPPLRAIPGDVLGKAGLDFAGPGDKLETATTVGADALDHRVAAGGQTELPGVGAGHMLAGFRGLMLETCLGLKRPDRGVVLALSQGREEIALEDDPLSLPLGQPLIHQMFGTAARPETWVTICSGHIGNTFRFCGRCRCRGKRCPLWRNVYALSPVCWTAKA